MHRIVILNEVKNLFSPNDLCAREILALLRMTVLVTFVGSVFIAKRLTIVYTEFSRENAVY